MHGIPSSLTFKLVSSARLFPYPPKLTSLSQQLT